MAPPQIIVTKLCRAEHGELEAHVSLGNGVVPVTRRYGSWQIENRSGLRDVLPRFAAELQRRARPFEKREAR
jgi:hypothetical protein